MLIADWLTVDRIYTHVRKEERATDLTVKPTFSVSAPPEKENKHLLMIVASCPKLF